MRGESGSHSYWSYTTDRASRGAAADGSEKSFRFAPLRYSHPELTTASCRRRARSAEAALHAMGLASWSAVNRKRVSERFVSSYPGHAMMSLPSNAQAPLQPSTDTTPWRDLVELISLGEVVPVVGDGAMAVRVGDEYRLFSEVLADELRRALAADCGLSVPVGTTVAEIAAFVRRLPSYRRHLPNQKLRLITERMLENVAAEDMAETLRQICEIDFPLIVTTSTTGLLERALCCARGRPPNVCSIVNGDKDLPLDFRPSAEAGNLVHIFGQTSNTLDFPLTDEDLLESLRYLYEERPIRLLQQLERRHLLFIGVCFPDWFARMFIRSLRTQPLSDHKGRLTALTDGTANVERKLTVFLEGLEPPMHVYKGDVSEFVARLHSTWSQRRPSKRTPDASTTPGRPPEPSVIFLSYSWADREAAKAVVKCLKEANLSVWFDEESAEPGKPFNPLIAEAIDRCVFFMPLLSRRTEEDRRSYFRKEWDMALERWPEHTGANDTFVVPLIVDDIAVEELRTFPTKFKEVTIRHARGGNVSTDIVKSLINALREKRAASRG